MSIPAKKKEGLLLYNFIFLFTFVSVVKKRHLLKILYDETSLNFYSSYPLVNRE